jgi:succinate dehydrogenase / fumarate reductase cytochrome b subunit/succinate dehydrogenase / fumarate reductase membrane anchor subunit
MIWFSKLNIERLLALLHKITGWTILGYLIVHVIFVNRLAHGELTEPEIFKYFLVLIGSVVVFHAMNGIRIILIETGHLIPKHHMEEPWIYYKPHRIYIWSMIIVTILSFFIGLYMVIR